MCNSRETSRTDASRFVVMGTGNGGMSLVADCETMDQATKYIDQMGGTYKKMGIALSISEVPVFQYE